MNGIDVSGYQGRVDWARVRRAGVRFAFVKATEGVGFVDPLMSSHAAGARAARIPFGFYHFARPDTRSGRSAASARADARAEADAFLAVAFPRPGQLLPVLDLERGGLPSALLAEWALAWLGRVLQRTGLRAIVYTYPAFWRGELARRRTFARHPLWIAHWGVAQPQVPAPWRGYAIWQHTSHASVDGVSGRVDANVLGPGVELSSLVVPAGEAPSPAPNLPGPVPKPPWFWPWLRWRLGTGEFEGLAREPAVRPDEAPERVPPWALACEEKLRRLRRGRR